MMNDPTSFPEKPRKKRCIAFFMPSLAGGGAERVMINLARYALKTADEVHLVLSSATGEYKEDIPPGIRLFELGHPKPIHAIPQLIRYLRKERPYSILSTLTGANLAALIATRLSGVPVRCFVRETTMIGNQLRRSPPFNRLIIPLMIRYLYPLAQSVFAPSEGAAKEISRTAGVHLKNTRVIPNPIVSGSIGIRSAEMPDHPWFEKTHNIVLGIGRLIEEKDFATLIRAFGSVRKKMNAKLVILGEGSLRKELEDEVRREGVMNDVSLPGFKKNPYAYLSRASVLVLSSKWEGLPGVLIEGLSCRTAVIATDCESGPREILDHGRYGQLVPVGDSNAMAEAILNVLTGVYKAEDPEPQIVRYDLGRNASAYLDELLR